MRVLTTRELNRALLERQLLLRRRRMPAGKAIEHLVGLQAQEPPDPYVCLWTRLVGFRPEHLAGMLTSRRAVRMTLMRGTIHLVTAADCLRLRPVMQAVLERTARGGAFGRAIQGIDVDDLLGFGRRLLEERPRTNAELRPVLRERWPKHDPELVSMVVRALLPLVQVPPRGVWGESGPAAHTTVEEWLDRPLPNETDPGEVVRRYLKAFGPATVADIRTWSGLAGLREVVDRLRPELRTFRDPSGRELHDVPRAPLPNPGIPAPPRFLPEFDNAVLSHEDRSRIVPPAFRTPPPDFLGRPLLVDGFVAGSWKLLRDRDVATLVVRSYRRLPAADRRAVEEEGNRLLGFLAGEAAGAQVRVESRR